MSQSDIAIRHKTAYKDQDKPFAELVYFLHSRIDETETITPVELFKWMEEHQQYAKSRMSELAYKQYKKNLKDYV